MIIWGGILPIKKPRLGGATRLGNAQGISFIPRHR